MPTKRQTSPVYEPLRAGAFFNSRRPNDPDCESCPGCIPIPVVLTVCGKVNRGHGVTVSLQVEGVHVLTATRRRLEEAMRAVRGWLDLSLTQPRGMA